MNTRARARASFDECQSEGKNISSLVWTGTNNTSSAKTMNIRQLLVQVDVMRAGKKHEQEIDRWAFGIWNGTGAGATRQGNDDEMAYNIGQCIAGYGTIYGTPTSPATASSASMATTACTSAHSSTALRTTLLTSC